MTNRVSNFRSPAIALGILAISSAQAFPGLDDVAKGAGISKPTLYVVGYSHLDTQWCWTYPQVIREFLPNTLHENFALFAKYPEYTFNWTGSNRYRLIKEYYPEDYAKLKKFVASGQWFPAGSSVEEGDVNNPSSESLIRQVLYGNEFFRHEFGVASEEYMLPDCFGFPASLPTILAHCGVKGFSTQKLTWGSAVGIPFNLGNWVGPDGTSVVAALNATSYTSNIEPNLANNPGWVGRLARDTQKTSVPADYRYYGVGDRGGAPEESDVRRLVSSMHTKGKFGISAGRADQMFNDLSQDQIGQLPSYKGDLELTQHSAGSITSESEMKRWNAKNEVLADDAERASVAADWLGTKPYDHDRITDGWLRFLPGQFHDLLAGTALPLAYTYSWNDQVIALNEFAGVVQSSVGGVARAMDTRGLGVPVVVYNPLSFSRADVVSASVHVDGAATEIRVYGPDGQAVPSQTLSHHGGDFRVLFAARVPSVGFAVYDLRPAVDPSPSSEELRVSKNEIENSRYRVTLNVNGDVSGIYDKIARHELLSGPARLVYQHENPSDYPAWNMDWSDQSKPPAAAVDSKPAITITERGPVRVALQVVRYHLGSKFVQTIRLSNADPDRVEFATRIDWRGKESALKAEFPLAVSNSNATYNWGIGTVERGNNSPKCYEMASHGWFDVTDKDGKYGVSVIKDAKFASDKPGDNLVRLTLLYTPGTRGGYQHQGTQDWGHHEFVYALMGHHGGWQSGAQQEALKLDQPMLAFTTPGHPGSLGKTFSTVQVSDPQVAVEALKKAEDSDEIIVRFNELAGARHYGVHAHFAAPVISAREVDGQERPYGPATIVHGDLVLDTTAYHPRAFAIRLDKNPAPAAGPTTTVLQLPYDVTGASFGHVKCADGFDGAGHTLPGELLPKTIDADGVVFQLGPLATGQKNVLSARGQAIPLPAGKKRKLYLLAAAIGGDRSATFQLDEHRVTLSVQAWDGYIGQWDTRIWHGEVPELTYDWSNALDGLAPGYIKRAPVAWYADHHRSPDGSDDIYQFCYLFRYTISVPDGVQNVTLPNDPKIRIMAMSVSDNPNDDTHAAQPLYDVLVTPPADAPTLTPTSGQFTDRIQVSVGHASYWTPTDRVVYSVDGQNPDLNSPTVTGPISIFKPTTLKIRAIDSLGKLGPIRAERYDVVDSTPPSVLEAHAIPNDPVLVLRLSEPVDKATAETVRNYALQPELKINAAHLDPDAQTVRLTLAAPVQESVAYRLTVSGVKDLSPAANPSLGTPFPLDIVKPSFVMTETATLTGTNDGITKQLTPKDLPVSGSSPWTINAFVYVDSAPKPLTILAGFGSGDDDSHHERFLIAKGNQISFWGSNIDVDSTEPFDIGKWQMITATFDGTMVRVYKNGKVIATESALFDEADPRVRIGPPSAWSEGNPFVGKVANLTIWPQALSPASLESLLKGAPK